jgi:pimeloyl-ACP methyl ester carboxylesterase
MKKGLLMKFSKMILVVFLGGVSLASAFTSVASAATTQKGYVTLQDGVARYAEFTPPTGNLPTVILINGLVYDVSRWQPFSQQLKKAGFGILNYYFRGQHLTLRKEALGKRTPAFFESGLNSATLGAELNSLIVNMKLKGPFVIVGLSYGSNIAAQFAVQNPRKVSQLILMSPLVQPLSNYDPTGLWLAWNLEQIRLWWGPIFGPTFYEMAYTQIYKSYLLQQIVPERIPAELADMPGIYRESIFHLVRAVRDFDLKKYRFETLPKGSVHFMLGNEDNRLMFSDQIKAFNGVSPAAKGNLIYMMAASHAIPDSQGAIAAQLTHLLINRDSRLKPGATYKVDAKGQVSATKLN